MTNTFTSKSGKLSLEIRDEGMSAWITVSPQSGLIDEREILQLIDQAGIKAGFEDAQRHIREHNLEKNFGEPFPVALCKSSPNSQKLNYYFDATHARKLSSSLDSSLMQSLSYVSAGTVVADYSSNLFDRQGSIYNVFGDIIPAGELDIEEADKKAGSGLHYDKHRNAYIADSTGYPYLDEEGKICILDTINLGEGMGSYQYPLHIPVNVMYEGNLDGASIFCQGKLMINGSVTSSFLSCEKDIDISGEIRGSELVCEGNLRVDGLISNCVGGGLQIGGILSCKAIESSYVLSRSQVRFTKQITDSLVIADAGLNGSIDSSVVDSHVQTCGSISLGSLGRVDGKATELEITISPFYKAMLTRYTKELIKLKEEPEQNSPEIEEIKAKIKACEGQLDQELNHFLARDSRERFQITVSGDVHPPAELRILKHSYTIKSYQNSLSLEEKD